LGSNTDIHVATIAETLTAEQSHEGKKELIKFLQVSILAVVAMHTIFPSQRNTEWRWRNIYIDTGVSVYAITMRQMQRDIGWNTATTTMSISTGLYSDPTFASAPDLYSWSGATSVLFRGSLISTSISPSGETNMQFCSVSGGGYPLSVSHWIARRKPAFRITLFAAWHRKVHWV